MRVDTSNTTHLAAQNIVQLPDQGTRSILPQTKQILQKVWKSHTIPPIIQIFTWRLNRRALASGNRAATYSNYILPSCTACGLIKTDAHLFFHCDLPRTVWFTSSLNLRTDSLPNEQDGIQNILQIMINSNTDENQLQAILITLWFIWKARNDK